MAVSKDAQAVLSGASQEAINYVTQNASGGQVTSGEAKALLAKFQANPSAVLTSGNIAETTTNPVPKPDDLLGIRKYIGNELGVDTKQAAYDAIYGQLSQYDTATKEQSRKINEQALSTNVLRGEDATATNLRANERLGIAKEADVALSSLQAAKSEQEAQFAIRQQEVRDKQAIMVQYPGAKIHAGDSYDSVVKKLDKYQEQVKKDTKKDALKEKLTSLGLSNKGNTKTLEKRLKKVNKKAYNDAQKLADLKIEEVKVGIENTKSIIKDRNSGTGTAQATKTAEAQLKRDQEFSAEVSRLVEDVNDPNKKGIDREVAKSILAAKFPEYDENQIYSVLPDQQPIEQPSAWESFWDNTLGRYKKQ